MNEIELGKVVNAWIAAVEVEENTPNYKCNFWAISQLIDWKLEGEAKLLWRFMLIRLFLLSPTTT